MSGCVQETTLGSFWSPDYIGGFSARVLTAQSRGVLNVTYLTWQMAWCLAVLQGQRQIYAPCQSPRVLVMCPVYIWALLRCWKPTYLGLLNGSL